MKTFATFFGLLILTTALGCGGGTEGRLPTFKVTGTVKYKGEAVEGADVILQFAEHNRASFGRTNASGEFTLGTYENKDGALAGSAVVTVSKWEELPPSNVPVAGDPGYDPSKAEAPEPKPKLLLPKKYADFKTTDLKVVIDANSKNPPLNLELQD
jgi:hypothetical protein